MSRVIESLKPQNARRMVADASNVPTLAWIGVALIIHVILIIATSVNYIRDTWIDPAGAQARAVVPVAPAPSPAPAPADATPTTKAPAAPPLADDKTLLEQRKDNPEVKKLNESAKPNEIPKTPQHDGFNLDDSSLK